MMFRDEDYEKCGIDIKSMREKQELLEAWRKDTDSKCQEINALKKQIECLKAEQGELQQVANFETIRDSDRIVIKRDTIPIDIATALVHADWISISDLQEIAEHLQAAYKNSWGE